MLAQNVPAPLFTRGMALMSVAIYDATVAAWDSKYAYNRQRPNAADKTINPLVAVPNSPSYPSEHAVAAGAASVVLAYLFPNIGSGYNDLAEECARSRVYSGTQYTSDIIAGLQLGRTIGAMVVAYAQADRSNTPFTASGAMRIQLLRWRGPGSLGSLPPVVSSSCPRRLLPIRPISKLKSLQ